MRRSMLIFVLSWFAFLIVSGCSDDSGTNSNDLGNLTGTWKLVEFSYTSKANPSQKVDWVDQGMNLTMTIENNGNFSVSGNYQGFTYSYSGHFDEGNDTIDDGDANTTITMSGDLLTITDENESYDFGNGDEPAILKQVYQKQ
jgi:hypothetical protein